MITFVTHTLHFGTKIRHTVLRTRAPVTDRPAKIAHL